MDRSSSEKTTPKEKDYSSSLRPVRVRLHSGYHSNRFFDSREFINDKDSVQNAIDWVCEEFNKDVDCSSPGTYFVLGLNDFTSLLHCSLLEKLNKENKNESNQFELCLLREEKKKGRTLRLPSLSMEKNRLIHVIILLTVGTSLREIYEIQALFMAEARKRFGEFEPENVFFHNFCLFLVGPYGTPLKEPASLFVKEMQQYGEGFLFTLQPRVKGSESAKVKVRRVLSKGVEWHDGKTFDEDCLDSSPVGISLHNRLPSSWHSPLLPDEEKAFYSRSEKQGSIEDFRPVLGNPQNKSKDSFFILMGHIKRGENHYQFYFDENVVYPSFEDEIRDFYDSIPSNYGQDVVHILLSPVQDVNARFMKDLLDTYFSGKNTKTIYIDPHEIKKDDFASLYKNILSSEESKKTICFHYIDFTICTGDTISRMMKLLSSVPSLCFKGHFDEVFLVLNRASYETAKMYVEKPEKSWHSYWNIRIPPYNTSQDHCPGCEVKDRYELLLKQTATNKTANEFARKWEKQTYRSLKETREAMFSVDLAKDVEWAYDAGLLDKDDPKYKCADKSESEEEILRHYSLPNKKNDKPKKEDVARLKAYLVCQEAYLRCITMDECYAKLVYLEPMEASTVDRAHEENDFEAKILSLIVERLKKIPFPGERKLNKNDGAEKRALSYEVFRTIISYIKVLARPNLGRNENIRDAIYQVMHSILFLFTDSRCRAPDARKAAFRDFQSNNKSRHDFVENVSKAIDNESAQKPLDVYNLCCLSILKEHIDKKYSYYNFLYVAIHTLETKIDTKGKLFGYVPYLPHQISLYRALCHRLALMHSRFVYLHQSLYSVVSIANERDANITKEGKDRIEKLSDYWLPFLYSLKTGAVSASDDTMPFHLLSLSKSILDNLSQSEIMRDVGRTMYLEASSSLYDLFSLLSRAYDEESKDIINRGALSYKGYDGRGGLKKRHELIKELSSFASSKVKEAYGENNIILRQNPIALKIEFASEVFGQGKPIDDRFLGLGLNYYRILAYLTGKEFEKVRQREGHFASLPYIYEDLVSTLRELMGAKEAYIALREGDNPPQTLCSSALCEDSLEFARTSPWTKRKVEGIINKADAYKSTFRNNPSKTSNPEYIDGIMRIKDEVSKEETILISIPFLEGKGIPDEDSDRFFHLVFVFDSDALPSVEKEQDFLLLLSKVLFLRQSLLSALFSDCDNLLSARSKSNYLKPLSNNLEKGLILHLSDLHLCEDYDDRCVSIDQLIKQGKIKMNGDGEVEFVFLTGDLIQAASDAHTAQRNYDCVKRFLYRLSVYLWGVEDENGAKRRFVLPHDYRKRILVVPGNHDYTAMNEVSIDVKRRAIASMSPADDVGGTMSKLTYYIEFLNDFLLVPIATSILYNGNEVRKYDAYGLEVALLSSVSEENPVQTNKVSLDREKIEELLQQTRFGRNASSYPLSVILIHHGPSYIDKLDYVADLYSGWYPIDYDEKKKEEFRSLQRFFLKNLKDTASYKIAFNEKELPMSFNEKYDCIFEEAVKNELSRLDPEFVRDYARLKEIHQKESENRPLNDYEMEFLSKVWRLDLVAAIDKANLEDFFDNIMPEKSYTVFSGHTHKPSIQCVNRMGSTVSYFDNVSDRFLRKSKKEKDNPITAIQLCPLFKGEELLPYWRCAGKKDDNPNDFDIKKI